jgi:hypothetical protein
MKTMLFTLLLPLVAYSQDYKLNAEGQAVPSYVGKVRAIKGKVFSLSKGKSKVAKVGTQLYRDDTLTTGERSIVKLMMVDDTAITLGPSSEIRFEDYQFVSKTERRIHSFVRGQLSSFVKNKANPGDLVFRTGATTFGIRGTHLLINARAINQVEVSEFALLSGNAELDDQSGSQQQLVAGDRIVIAENSVTKKRAREKMALTATEKDFLAVSDKDDEELLWPLLAFIEPAVIGKESSLYEVFHNEAAGAAGPRKDPPAPAAPPRESESTGTGTFENLRKLNEKLRQ